MHRMLLLITYSFLSVPDPVHCYIVVVFEYFYFQHRAHIFKFLIFVFKDQNNKNIQALVFLSYPAPISLGLGKLASLISAIATRGQETSLGERPF